MIRAALVLSLAGWLGLPHAAAAQEFEVTRQSYTFLDNHLVVDVLASAPGELQLVRGGRGRIEVAARSQDGFPGFGLGGGFTRELRLTSVGADRIHYLVVVPERVSVSVRLPGGGGASFSTSAAHGSWTWGADREAAGGGGANDAAVHGAASMDGLPLLPTLPGGLYLLHAGTWAPASVNVPDLGSVRTLSVRFEGSEFRIAASRPLELSVGRGSAFELRLGGEPLDVVLYVPRGNAMFELRSGATVLAQSRSGRVRALCGNVTVQTPSPSQDWLTFHPRNGRLDCR